MKLRRILVAFLALLALLSPISAAPAQRMGQTDNFAALVDRGDWKGKLTIYFVDLDVPPDSKDKSGDCSIIISPDEKVMMVDCGHPDAAKDVIRTMDALKLEKIDIFVLSHPHIDHLGAFPRIAERYPIGKVYRTRLQYPTVYARNFDSAVQKLGIPVEYVADGDSFEFGDSVHVEVYNPPQGEFVYPKGYPSNSTAFVNNSSILMKLEFGDSTALFGGDLYRAGEREIMKRHPNDLDSDVAKANHHGNDTSNQIRWIKAVSPKIVVAMNDVMGSMDVYKNFTKRGAVFYHTLYNGLVKVQLDGSGGASASSQFESWVEKAGR